MDKKRNKLSKIKNTSTCSLTAFWRNATKMTLLIEISRNTIIRVNTIRQTQVMTAPIKVSCTRLCWRRLCQKIIWKRIKSATSTWHSVITTCHLCRICIGMTRTILMNRTQNIMKNWRTPPTSQHCDRRRRKMSRAGSRVRKVGCTVKKVSIRLRIRLIFSSI